jgi:hypothetical protein
MILKENMSNADMFVSRTVPETAKTEIDVLDELGGGLTLLKR